ncbi:MAG: preprotein translocase subunit YajC [Alphaproteobacteria bacterium]|nr:preprotein translocase subunit YajC [Alphaproteobacteria bacterium]
MWIDSAYAQNAAATGGSDIFNMLMPMILIFGIMYFLLIRPQQKKHKRHQAKLNAVKRGDKVITGGGIYGTIRRVGDEGRIQVEIAKDVQVEVLAKTLTDVLLKTEPQPQSAAQAQESSLLGKFLGGNKAAQPASPPRTAKLEPKKDEPKKSEGSDDKGDNDRNNNT